MYALECMDMSITFSEWLEREGMSVLRASQEARVCWAVANKAKKGEPLGRDTAAKLSAITNGDVSAASLAFPEAA